MDGFTFQSHAVYRNKKTGAILLLVHHNPMALCSLLFTSDANGFNTKNPQLVSIDTIIEMRRSGNFEQLECMPDQQFLPLLKEIRESLPAEEIPCLDALIKQITQEE